MADRKKVIVIGGGPAGLMAAGQAALQGADVRLLEKMYRCGLKLRLTGKGRCNIANSGTLRQFCPHFQTGAPFIRTVCSRFYVHELVHFLQSINIECVTQNDGRMFPAGNNANTVTDALVRWAEGCGVAINTDVRIGRIIASGGRVTGVSGFVPDARGERKNTVTYQADAVILATGGASYPETGSNGDGYALASALGHCVVTPEPALVPLWTAVKFGERIPGTVLENIRLSVYVDNKKQTDCRGDTLFTHIGMSGPATLIVSSHAVRGMSRKKKAQLSIDSVPDRDDRELDRFLVDSFTQHGRMVVVNMLKELIPARYAAHLLESCDINHDSRGHEITAEQRKRLRMALKDFRVDVTGHEGFEKAIVTAGGVSLDEVDPETMGSRKVAGLFLAGEVLDLDADTGGYNLQAAFSTGWTAGRSAAGTPGL